MRTFDGWRAVGRAMRWARRQDGVTAHRHREYFAQDRTAFDLEWRRSDGHGALVSWMNHRELVDVRAGGPVKDCYMSDWDNAVEVLRVLAALDLIPADLAEVHDERYRKCVRCDRIARRLDDGPGFEPRWVHINPAATTGPGAHRAEVAE